MPLLQFKVKTKGEAVSPFEQLVAQRVAVERELRALNSPRGWKLSPKAFLKEALQHAHADEAELEKLRAMLESASGLEHIKAALRRMVAFVKSPQCSRPTSELRRLDFLLRPEGPEILVHLVGLKATTFLLFALAVAIAGEQSPESFGTAESSRVLDEKLLQLTLRRDELDKEIAAAFTQDDLQYSDPDSAGRVKVTFKMTGGKVGVYPNPEAAGERLANFFCRSETSP
jgi:hypothetical protein